MRKVSDYQSKNVWSDVSDWFGNDFDDSSVSKYGSFGAFDSCFGVADADGFHGRHIVNFFMCCIWDDIKRFKIYRTIKVVMMNDEFL